MGTRAEALAKQFEAKAQEAAAVLEKLSDPPETLQVTGTGKVQAEPDEAVVDLGVFADAKTAAEAVAANAKQTQAVIDAVSAEPNHGVTTLGLGVSPEIPTWGTMLQDASNVTLLGDAPWSLAPAAGIFAVVLGINLLAQSEGRAPVQLEP